MFKEKIKKVQSLNDTLIKKLIALHNITNDQQIEIIDKLNQINDVLKELQIYQPDHGPKPLFGHVDRDGLIPYVKVEYVQDIFAGFLKISPHGVRKSELWKRFKEWLDEKYNLRHTWSHVFNVHGVMVIWKGVNKETMDDYIKEFLY
jgi:hypothetical protein